MADPWRIAVVSKIYEFTDYVEVINSDGNSQWLCPSEKVAKINTAGLIKLYEFYETISGSFETRAEVVITQDEWEKVKHSKFVKILPENTEDLQTHEEDKNYRKVR